MAYQAMSLADWSEYLDITVEQAAQLRDRAVAMARQLRGVTADNYAGTVDNLMRRLHRERESGVGD